MLFRNTVRAAAVLIAPVFFAGTTSWAQDQAAPPAPAPAPAPAPEPAPAPAPEAAPPPAAAAPAPEATPAEPQPAKKRRTGEEEIVVTGSRIRRKDLTTPAPITLIGKEQIQDSGKASLGDFLQTLPEQGNATNTNVNNAGDGATRIDLRGLGAQRTLVLVNGRRWVPGGLGADSSVDLNSIPTAAIDHVEILKDGASSIYGSDAISGVVNIITRKRYDGAELSAYAGTSSHGDGTQYSVDGTIGTAGERGSLMFSAGWFEQYPIFAGDRSSWASPQVVFDGSPGGQGYLPQGSGTIPQGRILIPASKAGKTVSTATTLYNNMVTTYPTKASFIRDPSTSVCNAAGDPGAQGCWRPYKGPALNADGYNFEAVNYLTVPESRFQLFSAGDTKIGPARAYFEAALVHRESGQQLAPEPLVLDQSGLKVSGQNQYNPFGVDVIVRRRLLEFGPRTFAQQINSYHFVAGLDGTLPDATGPLQGWYWDLSLNYGRFEGTQEIGGNLITTKIADAIGPSFADATGNHCGTASNVIAGCVPLNLFGGPGTISHDQTTGLTYDGVSHLLNALTSFQANTSGELFKLAASRPVGLALGYEYRFQAGAQTVDPVAANGWSSDNNGNSTAGHYYSNEGYGELSIPIVSDLPGLDDLEVTLAARLYNYNNFGGGATYKAGLLYRPVAGFSLRGTYSTAFRAPSIPDLYTGQADSFEPVADPCSGTHGTPPRSCGSAANNQDSANQLRALIGGNTGLKPETANIATGGIVFEPGVLFGQSQLKRFSATLDYYNIDITNSITTLGANTILADCYVPDGSGQTPQYCNLITRDPNTHLITKIIDTNINAGGTKTSGLDLGLNYMLPTPAGRFGLVADFTWLFNLDVTLPTGQVVHAVNTWDNNAQGIGGVYPTFKGLFGVNWGLSGFSAGVTGRYVGGFKECGDAGGGGAFDGPGLCYQDTTYQRAVSNYTEWNFFLGYGFKSPVGKTNLQVGMNNVFDITPPFIANAFEGNSDPANYDFVGRYMYARLSQAF